MFLFNPNKYSYCLTQIADLERQFPELKTYWSCDLSPASWVSFAWYVFLILFVF